MKVLKILLVICLVCTLAGVGGAVWIYNWAAKDLPGFKNITDYNPPLVTTVYAKDNEVLGYFYKEKRFLVTLDQMSPWLPKAFLASEDASFYEHDGVDMTAIARAFIANLKAGRTRQGGSTITQQIIKRLLLTSERSYQRKLKEAILAFRLENYLTKEEILTIYLNHIFLGAHSYGVEAASRTYFAKHANELTIAQAAMLAGLPQAPTRYNPYRNMHFARQRQEYVLGQMRSLGWITEAQYQEAMDEEIELESMPDPSWKVGAYYLEEVRRWLVAEYGEDATYNGGLTVTTPCDLKHQRAAEKAVKRGLLDSAKRRGWTGPLENVSSADMEAVLEQGPQDTESIMDTTRLMKAYVTKVQRDTVSVNFGVFKGIIPIKSMWWVREPDIRKSHEDVPNPKDARKILEKGDVVWVTVAKAPKEENGIWTLDLEREPKVQGAMVSITPDTGEVVALVGGYDFEKSQFNRASQAKRQPGSAFKPIVYSTALDNGFTPSTLVLDAPIVYANDAEGKLWRPQNFEGTFDGPILLRTALVKSKNLCTIRVAQKIGIRKIIERAKAMGLDTEFPHDLSVSLGSASVSLMNLCEAYTAFPRGGSYVKPRTVLSVKSAWGEDLYTSAPEVSDAISPQTAFILSTLMKQVVSNGTGWRARVLKRPVAGKTGTSNNEHDAWYMGFSPYLLTGVYVGFDELTPMGKWETGSRAASPLWVKYRQAVEKDYPYEDFTEPPGIVMVRVDAKTGKLASPSSAKEFFLPFKVGSEPTEMAPSRSGGGSGDGPVSDDDLFKQTF
ncbi:PBP1A family penicillin-binding protein [Pseudodesulfovibrio sp. JC047]|uniref:penicillin-binding protein 1A n=1 Tax=Pseudodesulfovibrio sp. JC047 TaxID=2683199 RepID=UPI0013D52ABA|nr:PBP1A family penicillin-binding protein [Pseudodesulfovibrio sp. JC047]NDV19308.1 PBP1A family penicillin-binding protein [Pseudodesulfovibrio sp. JC047]